MSDGTVAVLGVEEEEEPRGNGETSEDGGTGAISWFRASPAEWTKLKELPRLCPHRVCRQDICFF